MWRIMEKPPYGYDLAIESERPGSVIIGITFMLFGNWQLCMFHKDTEFVEINWPCDNYMEYTKVMIAFAINLINKATEDGLEDKLTYVNKIPADRKKAVFMDYQFTRSAILNFYYELVAAYREPFNIPDLSRLMQEKYG